MRRTRKIQARQPARIALGLVAMGTASRSSSLLALSRRLIGWQTDLRHDRLNAGTACHNEEVVTDRRGTGG